MQRGSTGGELHLSAVRARESEWELGDPADQPGALTGEHSCLLLLKPG